MARFRSVKPHVLTKALNALTPGIIWSGCAKGNLAEKWAAADHRMRMDSVELDHIEAKLREQERRK